MGRRYAAIANGTTAFHLRFAASRLKWPHAHQAVPLGGTGNHARHLDSGKRSSGIWRATNNGISFVLHDTEVPSHAFCSVPGHTILGFEDTAVTIHDVLRKRFDYNELMQGGNGVKG